MYGKITGNEPSHVKIIAINTKNQKKKLKKGLKKLTRIKDLPTINGKNNNTTIIKNNNKIPNNLSVTLRNTAYNGKKYHSGTI